MKIYYLHDGTVQQGPFDIEDLKGKNITKETSIWHEGLSEWTTADKIDDLKDLLKTTIPPPFGAKKTTPPPIQKTPPPQTTTVQQATKMKSSVWRTILIIVGLLVLVVVGLFVANNMNSSGGGGYGTGGDTYQEKVMTVEEIERSQPTNFLTAEGNYNESFWGDKINVHGVIKNTATVASYKDAVVRVTYYSKTKTELGSKEYTIYDNFPPHSEVKFELKIENYKDVNSIGWDVIQAIAN